MGHDERVVRPLPRRGEQRLGLRDCEVHRDLVGFVDLQGPDELENRRVAPSIYQQLNSVASGQLVQQVGLLQRIVGQWAAAPSEIDGRKLPKVPQQDALHGFEVQFPQFAPQIHIDHRHFLNHQNVAASRPVSNEPSRKVIGSSRVRSQIRDARMSLRNDLHEFPRRSQGRDEVPDTKRFSDTGHTCD